MHSSSSYIQTLSTAKPGDFLASITLYSIEVVVLELSALAALQLPSGASWRMPELPAALVHTAGKNVVFSFSTLSTYFRLFC